MKVIRLFSSVALLLATGVSGDLPLPPEWDSDDVTECIHWHHDNGFMIQGSDRWNWAQLKPDGEGLRLNLNTCVEVLEWNFQRHPPGIGSSFTWKVTGRTKHRPNKCLEHSDVWLPAGGPRPFHCHNLDENE